MFVLIEVRDLYFCYGENDFVVLDGVFFFIKVGELVVIVGLLGCGKIILLKLFVGLLILNRGDIFIDGELFKVIGVE